MNDRDGYDFVDVADLILELAIPAADTLSFNLRDSASFAAIALYCSLLEAGWSCLALLEKKLGYHAYPLLRSVLEVSVEIDCLLDNPDHANNIELANSLERQKMFSRASSGNPYLASIGKMDNLAEKIIETDAEIKALRSKGAKKLSTETKFHKVGRQVDYDGLWRMLGNDVHGNLNALIKRHVDFSGGIPSTRAFNHGELSEFDALTTSLFETTEQTSIKIHSHFGTKFSEPSYWRSKLRLSTKM